MTTLILYKPIKFLQSIDLIQTLHRMTARIWSSHPSARRVRIQELAWRC
jgi:hypothetical protein